MFSYLEEEEENRLPKENNNVYYINNEQLLQKDICQLPLCCVDTLGECSCMSKHLIHCLFNTDGNISNIFFKNTGFKLLF